MDEDILILFDLAITPPTSPNQASSNPTYYGIS